jgi:hypothetical protein
MQPVEHPGTVVCGRIDVDSGIDPASPDTGARSEKDNHPPIRRNGISSEAYGCRQATGGQETWQAQFTDKPTTDGTRHNVSRGERDEEAAERVEL